MLDPRQQAILIADSKTGEFVDRTWEVASFHLRPGGSGVDVTFANRSRLYSYGPKRARVLRNPARVPVPPGGRVEVDGRVWSSPTEVLTFSHPDGAWSRIFYNRASTGEAYSSFPAERVRIVPSAAQDPAVAEVVRYWQDIVSRLRVDDPLRRPYARLQFVHPDSVLARYLKGAPITPRELATPAIFPFRCNLSQRDAVDNALGYSISVIEGPPGTGKTETILNLVANIIAAGAGTVGVVSFNNAAVDNVRDKLDASGFGHVIANLGRADKRQEFFAAQATRNELVATFLRDAPPTPPPPERMADVDRHLRQLQAAERTRAELRGEADAYRLERQHFEQHLQRHEVAELEGLPLLRRSADRILDYLAETELERGNSRPGLLGRIRRYLRYGSLRGLDPDDTDVVLRLQRAYYDKRIAELENQIRQVEDGLRRADFPAVVEDHRALSTWTLRAALTARYQGIRQVTYSADTYDRGSTFSSFTRDYPVLLSTCHSLLDSIADGYLLDYLVIDEASQVNLLAAGLALSCCRNLIVVGDLRQLPHIADHAADNLVPPGAAYDYRQHSILSSLIALYGDALPRALLREHYRCDPAIIGFCNKAFYRGDLIPYTTSATTSDTTRPMLVVRTVEGNHMRQHRTGGRSNQREADVIAQEVIPTFCASIDSTDIGVTSPYRFQVDKVAGALADPIEADTVHKFQGRQKQVIIFSTVLDETWRGRSGLRFVDDPQLVNVAVSRAAKRFILVTNNQLLPKSRHIRDLIGYIRYHNPGDEVVDSAVISMFDLLYREYSPRLRRLARRLRNELRYKSEDIIWTVLHEILAEPAYGHLVVSNQVLLKHLLADLSRLTPGQATYVQNRASLDFVVYNRVTNQPLLAIEVDGFAFHEDNPAQREKDVMKDEILRAHQLPLLRLPTTGSGEDHLIRLALDSADAHGAQLSQR